MTVFQTGHQNRSGTADIMVKTIMQKTNGDQNCISIGQRVPGVQISDIVSSAIVGPTMQAPIRNAKPSEVPAGLG